MSTQDYKEGDHVIYIPNHAHGDRHHPDSEHGVVTSQNESVVFVRYGSKLRPEATDPDDLQLV